MRLTSAVSGAFLVMVLALSGCGGDDDSDGGSDDTSGSEAGDSGDSGDSGSDVGDGGDEALDVCGLLTADDLEEVFGSPFDDGEATHQEQTGGDQCVWSNTDPPPVKIFSITVLREGHLSETFEDGGVTVKGLFEDTKALMTDVEDIDLGDDAYLAGSELAVLDGDTSYSFSTVLGTSPEAIAGLKTLAEQVVG
jgi:hypothetical protein